MAVDQCRKDYPQFAADLLGWYDAHARDLPWRSPPRAPAPDPYRVWLSEIMLQQTTVAAVKPYFAAFTKRWPTIDALAAADEAELMAAWAGLGYYARARNLLACARAVASMGAFPDSEAELLKLPGIGPYTAAAIAAIAFGRHAVVVDGNVERVAARVFALEAPLPGARPELRRLAANLTPEARCGDFAQAMMDLGATICTPRAPKCQLCPVTRDCAGRDRAEQFPVKAPKAARPERKASLFWLTHGDEVLLVRRPPEGLLGGMRALPTGSWQESDPGFEGAPADVAWENAGTVRHIFTHFALEATVWRAAGDVWGEAEGEWWPINRIDEAGLPTLFVKAAARATA